MKDKGTIVLQTLLQVYIHADRLLNKQLHSGGKNEIKLLYI